MKKLILLITLIMPICTMACADDFWETYSKNLTYNYSVKTGAIPDLPRTGQRLSNDEMISVLTKSFSQSLGQRLGDVADQRSAVAIVCIFHPEPERCFGDFVLGATFDEVHFMNPPGFSQKFFKKVSKYYAYTLNDDEQELERRGQAARRVPPWKRFNPRFGFNLNEPEVMMSTPFYSFGGVYVEPRYGTSRGASISFLYKRYFVDVQQEGVELKYSTGRNPFGRGYLSVSIRPEGEIYISNEFMMR